MEATENPLLRRALVANALFSGLSGLVLLLAAGTVGSWIGVSSLWLLRVIGGGLILFALDLWRHARRDDPGRGFVLYASGSDFAWVVGSGVLLLGFPEVLSSAGQWVVGSVAVVVAAFGTSQLVGLARSRG